MLLAGALQGLAPGSANAHGEHEPKYGGIIGRTSDDIVVELVVEKGVVSLYIEDETAPIPSDKVKGTLTLVPAQRPRQEAKLVPAHGNRLTAPGLKPAPGDKLRAYIVLPNGDEVSSVFLYSK